MDTHAHYTITRLGHHGDGITQNANGKALFAPLTLPGEIVTGDIDGDKIKAPRIQTPSADRIKAPCAHYNTCGGCSLQHARDEYVANWKRDVAITALKANGLEANVAPKVATSAAGTRRRASLAGRRTKKGALVGFHGRATNTLTAVPNCLVVHPDLLAKIPALERLTKMATSRSAEVKYHLTLGDTGVDLAIEGAKPLDNAMRLELTTYASDFARVTWNGDPALQASSPGQRFGTARIVPPPASFLQATKDGEQTLVDLALEGINGAKRVVDLFAGCGTFTFPAAARAAVHAVEGEKDLIEALDHGIRHNQDLKPITAQVRDLFRNPLLAEELDKFDAAIIDPPRAGAEAQTRQLATSKIKRIAAISCNPVTFARDAKILIEAGYTLGTVHVIDQFRWSPHIELAASFHKDQ